MNPVMMSSVAIFIEFVAGYESNRMPNNTTYFVICPAVCPVIDLHDGTFSPFTLAELGSRPYIFVLVD